METSNLSLREISAEDTYPIRQQILRPGKPRNQVFFEGDFEEETLHLGAYSEKELVAVASFMKSKFKNFNQEEQFRLRGMAVLPEAQKLGVGSKILIEGELLLKQKRNAQLLWFNARESAVGFYEKHGYQTFGDFFEIPDVCTHIVMFKTL